MVAYGMVGASVSGVSFVSVPGMVATQDLTYLQTCLGFILGYALVAFVLLPIYYRLNLTSIYSLLDQRLGAGAYRVGAWFFILSDLIGSAVKFYLVCVILQRFVFDAMGMPFWATVPLLVLCIWLYTRRGGVRTLVLTDVVQTTCMLLALCLIVWVVVDVLGGWNVVSTVLLPQVFDAPSYSGATGWGHVFDCEDWTSPRYFWRQFVSGAFIVVVMTGLNQNMMQKNLTCKTLRDAQKDMCLSGVLFLPVNAIFLLLGVLLLTMRLPAAGDELLPYFVENLTTGEGGGVLGCALAVRALFMLGIVSAAFSSADSSLTALTTSFCVDIAAKPDDERLRHRVHILMSALLIAVVYLLRFVGSQSLIDTVYTLVGYTYGPLLGMFALALLTKHGQRHDINLCFTAIVCLISPLCCYIISRHCHLGYELLLINAAITFLPLWLYCRIVRKNVG